MKRTKKPQESTVNSPAQESTVNSPAIAHFGHNHFVVFKLEGEVDISARVIMETDDYVIADHVVRFMRYFDGINQIEKTIQMPWLPSSQITENAPIQIFKSRIIAAAVIDAPQENRRVKLIAQLATPTSNTIN